MYKKLAYTTVFLYIIIVIPLVCITYNYIPSLIGLSIPISGITAIIIAPKILKKL